MVDLAATARVTGAVTKMIPIPMEWASMFVNGPNFGTAFRRVFDLFNSLKEENPTALYPILEMIGVACCAANDSAMPPSTLSTQWTHLACHVWTKRWAAEAWARHLEPVKQVPPDPEDPPPPAALSPSAQLKDLFGHQRKWPAGGPMQAAITLLGMSPPSNPQPPFQSAKTGMEMGDLGSIFGEDLGISSRV
jgi:hypothetical protein